MKKKILFLLILFIPFMVCAEEIKMEWQRSFGGNDHDIYSRLFQLNDNSTLFLGFTHSTDIEGFSNLDKNGFVMIKYDDDGNLLWKQFFDGNGWYSFSGLFQQNDGSIILAGTSDSTDIEGLSNKGSDDIILIKYDKDGNLLWKKSYGGNGNDSLSKLYQLDDNYFILLVQTNSTDIDGLPNKGAKDTLIIKYDKDGNIVWQKSFGGNGWDYLDNLFQLEDDSIILADSSNSTDIDGLSNKGSDDIILIKYDKDGNLLWKKSYGGNGTDSLFKLYQLDDNYFILLVKTNSTDIDGLPNKGSEDTLIIKYDKDGNIVWQKSFGGNGWDSLDNLFQLEDDSIILAGSSNSTDIVGLTNNGEDDAIVIKYDKEGNLLWQKSFGGSSGDSFYHIFVQSDGSVVATGTSASIDIDGIRNKGDVDIIIVKYDKEGNLLWKNNFGGSGLDLMNDGYQQKDDSIILVGNSSSNDIDGITSIGEQGPIIFKFNKDGNFIWKLGWGGSNYEEMMFTYQNTNGDIIIAGTSDSTDIEGLSNYGLGDMVIVKFSVLYDLQVSDNLLNGRVIVEQQGRYGIVKPTPKEEYEVDKIIVKDKSGNVLDVEVTKQEDGTYSFELYTDVSVEVLFKEKLVNPKTGVSSFIGVMFTLMLIGISGFFMIRNCNNSYEL